MFIQCQWNGLAASEPHHEPVLVCSQHKSFMNILAFKSLLPFKNRQRSCMRCGLIDVQNRCKCTIWMGMKSLSYCAPQHGEHYSSRNPVTILFREYGLTGFREGVSERALLFSSLRAALGHGTVLIHLPACSTLPEEPRADTKPPSQTMAACSTAF